MCRSLFLTMVMALAAVLASCTVREGRGSESAACVVTVAGDIAASGTRSDPSFVDALRTGDIVRSVAPKYALTAGDNAYPDGTASQFKANYDPTWGSFRAITLPTPGNHDYHTSGGRGYYDYFFDGKRKGTEYYARNCRRWRLYALNCEVPCGEGSQELAWLKADLAAHPGRHYLAYLHEPRFTSYSAHSENSDVSPIWRALQEAGGDIVVGGHNHFYERFAKQNAEGDQDPNGMRQFVVGHGGAPLYEITRVAPHSEFRDASHYGVLRLSLKDNSYSWQDLSSGRVNSSELGANDSVHPLGAVLDSGMTATNKGTTGNERPTVTAGPDLSGSVGGRVTLDGNVTDDGLPKPDGHLVTSWSKVTGPGVVSFTKPDSVDTTVTFDTPGTYTLRLTADDTDLQSSDELVARVTGAEGTQTFERRSSGAEDAEQTVNSGFTRADSSDLEMVEHFANGGGEQLVGLRFSGVQVPAGATVTNAYVQFESDEVSNDTASLRIRAEVSDEPDTYASASTDISRRRVTAASVAWTPPPWPTVGVAGPDQRTPNLAVLIQTVIDRSGWRPGNALALQVSGTGRRTARASESGAGGAPLLHVDYVPQPRG